jgi:hypothetical protein
MADSSQDLIKPEKLLAAANIKLKENQNFFRKLKSANPHKLDVIVNQLHEEVFTYTDCLVSGYAQPRCGTDCVCFVSETFRRCFKIYASG